MPLNYVSGLVLTQHRLRALPTYYKTPIITVSGMGSPFAETKGIISGCTTYVIKPIQHGAFLELCKNILKQYVEFIFIPKHVVTERTIFSIPIV
jgi:hypothetical protein